MSKSGSEMRVLRSGDVVCATAEFCGLMPGTGFGKPSEHKVIALGTQGIVQDPLVKGRDIAEVHFDVGEQDYVPILARRDVLEHVT